MTCNADLADTPTAYDASRYTQLLEAVGDAVITVDLRHRIVEFNPEAERVFGYAKSEIFGKSINKLLPKGNRPNHDRYIEGFAAETVQRRLMRERSDVRGLRKDGQEFDAEISIAKIEISGDLFFMAIVRDVSVRKKLERDLRESNQHLRQAQQLAGLASWEHDVPTGKVRWSAQIYDIFGIEAGTLQPSAEIFFSRVPPDDRLALRQRFAEVLAKRGTTMSADLRIIRPDGTERILHELSELTWGEDGQLLRQIGTLQDVTEQRKSDDRLRQSEQLLNRAQELANLGSWEHNTVTGQNSWSRHFFTILGLDPLADRPSDELFMSIVHPDERADVRRRYAEALENRAQAALYDTRIVRRDGAVRILRNIVEYFWSETDELLRINGTSQDVTENLAAANKLARSERSLVNAQRIAHIGSWDWDVETDTLYWSDEIYRIYGMEPAEFVPSPTALLERVHPDDRERLEADVDAALRGERPLDNLHRIILPSGTIRTLHEQGEVIFSSDGKPLQITGAVQDVTESKRATVELERSESSLAQAQRIANIGSWEADLVTGEFRWSSGLYALAGLDPTKHKPDTDLFLSLIHPDDRAAVVQATNHALAGDDENLSGSYRLVRPDGIERVVQSEIGFIKDQAGGTVGVIGSLQDVTEQLETERALKAALDAAHTADTAKSEFLANMSHELRTPLNAIIGFADILASEKMAPAMTPRDREYARDIRDSGLHLLEIINDVLDFSRVEAGRADIQHEPIDTNALMAWVVKLLEKKAVEKGLRLTIDVAPEAGQFRGDARLMRQTLLNLVGNAIKFTLSGEVSLKATKTSDQALILSVSDTGIGMRPADIPAALTPFTQLENSLQRHYEGVGLGLPLAKRFVELHGGEFDVTSEPSMGTTVTIKLPA